MTVRSFKSSSLDVISDYLTIGSAFLIALTLVLAAVRTSHAETSEEEEVTGGRTTQRVAPRIAFADSSEVQVDFEVTNFANRDLLAPIVVPGNGCRVALFEGLCSDEIQVATLQQTGDDRIQMQYDFSQGLTRREKIAAAVFDFTWSGGQDYYDASAGIAFGLRAVPKIGLLPTRVAVLFEDAWGTKSTVYLYGIKSEFKRYQIAANQIVAANSKAAIDLTNIASIAVRLMANDVGDANGAGTLEIATGGGRYLWAGEFQSEFERLEQGPTVTEIESDGINTVNLTKLDAERYQANFRRGPGRVGALKIVFTNEFEEYADLDEGFSVALGLGNTATNMSRLDVTLVDTHGRKALFAVAGLVRSFSQYIVYPEMALSEESGFEYSKVQYIELNPNNPTQGASGTLFFSTPTPLWSHRELPYVKGVEAVLFPMLTAERELLISKSVVRAPEEGHGTLIVGLGSWLVKYQPAAENEEQTIVEIEGCTFDARCSTQTYLFSKSSGDQPALELQTQTTEPVAALSTWATREEQQKMPTQGINDSQVMGMVARLILLAEAEGKSSMSFRVYGKLVMHPFGKPLPMSGTIRVSLHGDEGASAFIDLSGALAFGRPSLSEIGRPPSPLKLWYHRMIAWGESGVIRDHGSYEASDTWGKTKDNGYEQHSVTENFVIDDGLHYIQKQYDYLSTDYSPNDQSHSESRKEKTSFYNWGVLKGITGEETSKSFDNYPSQYESEYKSKKVWNGSLLPKTETSYGKTKYFLNGKQSHVDETDASTERTLTNLDASGKKKVDAYERAHKWGFDPSGEQLTFEDDVTTTSVTLNDKVFDRTVSYVLDKDSVHKSIAEGLPTISTSAYRLKQLYDEGDFHPTYAKETNSYFTRAATGAGKLGSGVLYKYSDDSGVGQVIFQRNSVYGLNGPGTPTSVTISYNNGEGVNNHLGVGWNVPGFEFHTIARTSTPNSWDIEGIRALYNWLQGVESGLRIEGPGGDGYPPLRYDEIYVP